MLSKSLVMAMFIAMLSGGCTLKFCKSDPVQLSTESDFSYGIRLDYNRCKCLEYKSDSKVNCIQETKRRGLDLTWNGCQSNKIKMPTVAIIVTEGKAIARKMSFKDCANYWK